MFQESCPRVTRILSGCFRNAVRIMQESSVLLNFREIIYDLDIRAVQDYAEAVPKSARIMETLQMEVL